MVHENQIDPSSFIFIPQRTSSVPMPQELRFDQMILTKQRALGSRMPMGGGARSPRPEFLHKPDMEPTHQVSSLWSTAVAFLQM